MLDHPVREVDEEGSGSARCDLFLFVCLSNLVVGVLCYSGCCIYNSLLACNILEVFFDTQFPTYHFTTAHRVEKVL